ncbi:MAG TPA: aldehyde dehydrogenase [Synechococcales cyanobacterium M55_K2018_004]|nr:aldehyde dehydrogenase [Synechococcales cyanobacterium M55_K2018_004]
MLHQISHQIPAIIQQQRAFFATGQTHSLEFRLAQLQRLRQAVLTAKAEIVEAVQADLGRSEFEAYTFEMGVLQEINYALKHLKHWMRPKRVAVPLEQRPGTAWVQPEPLGVVLIIGPWNYPFQLVLSPLVGAIAAGNCAILKPSELAPHTSAIVAKLIGKTFDPDYITVLEGGVETSQALLEERFDHIFFTGGTAIGKVVMAAAAKHLTPVTLELGGKSPCIVDTDIDLAVAARRIAWGKLINAGQTCIAPDYLLVNRNIAPALLDALKQAIQQFYGEDPATSPDYGKIINPRHYARLEQFLADGTIFLGGQTNPDQRYIAPTVLVNVSPHAAVMQEEIFGPILPVLEYDDVSEAIAYINANPKPLALYLFSRDRVLQERILRETSSGGVCLNDTVMQVALSSLPFGGVGASGMGRYHGKASFDTFSHPKSVLRKPFWPDLKWRYAPYEGKLEFIKKMLGG